MKWYKGFINLSTGAIETNNETYPNSYYTNLIKLKAGVTYTLSGYGTYDTENMRWRLYNEDGTYYKNGPSSNTYTAEKDCYVRVMYFSNPTADQRTGTILTSSTMSSVEIPKGSQGNRTYTAHWAKLTLSKDTIYVKTGGTGVIAKEGTPGASSAQVTYTVEGVTELEFTSENTNVAEVATTDNISATVTGKTGQETKIVIKDKATGVTLGELTVIIDSTLPYWTINIFNIT